MFPLILEPIATERAQGLTGGSASECIQRCASSGLDALDRRDHRPDPTTRSSSVAGAELILRDAGEGLLDVHAAPGPGDLSARGATNLRAHEGLSFRGR